MKEKDARLKLFFDELYASSNPQSKNKKTQTWVKKQLLFVCYFLCGIRNKFVNNAKRDLTLYLDSTSVSNTTIDTLADLGIMVTSLQLHGLRLMQPKNMPKLSILHLLSM